MYDRSQFEENVLVMHDDGAAQAVNRQIASGPSRARPLSHDFGPLCELVFFKVAPLEHIPADLLLQFDGDGWS